LLISPSREVWRKQPVYLNHEEHKEVVYSATPADTTTFNAFPPPY
jgi:hypothetical protein